MLSNITSNPGQEGDRRQALHQQGDHIYLYGDTSYTGSLIRPIERSYPQKWSVQLDRGGYEAANVEQISLLESQSSNPQESDNLDIPFGDVPESSYVQLQQEILALKSKNAQLQQENEVIKKDLEQAKQIIRRAKDISPIMRLSLKRVLRLAHDACLDVQRTIGGWILRMGDRARKFKRLADIWDLLSVDEFVLSEIFPEDQLIAIDLIQPAPPRKKPQPLEKKTFPLMRPEDILRNRTMFLIPSG